MSRPFVIKQGDRLPTIQAALIDGNGVVVDLTNADSVKFLMRDRYTGTVKVNAEGSFVSPLTGGKVEYTWVLGDTDTVSDYECEWEVTDNGKKQTYPASGYLYVIVQDDIG